MDKLDMLIDELADAAAPVRPQSARFGRIALGIVALASMLATFALLGIREDVARLAPSPLVGIAGGLMLLLAIAAGSSAVRMARPQVGAMASGAPWALAALLLLPAVALSVVAEPAPADALVESTGLRCLGVGLAASIATIGFLSIWQRLGAPVRPRAAAWFAGLCGGAVGALAVTLECGLDGLAHIGIWHVAVVPLAGLAAWLLLPRFLRW